MTGEFRRRAKAFTLVELLVVIGIIGVLVALLLPSLNAARNQAKRVNCLAHLQQIGQALMIYAPQHKGWFPHRVSASNNKEPARGPASGYGIAPYGVSLLVADPYGYGDKYLPNNDVFFCPSDLVRAPYRKAPHFWGPASQDDTGSASMSYWQYYYPDAVAAYAVTPVARVGPQDFVKAENYRMTVKNPSAKVLYTDQYISKNWDGSGYILIKAQYQTFHKEGLNAVYADGHATWIKAGQVEDYWERVKNVWTGPHKAFYYWLVVATANENP